MGLYVQHASYSMSWGGFFGPSIHDPRRSRGVGVARGVFKTSIPGTREHKTHGGVPNFDLFLSWVQSQCNP